MDFNLTGEQQDIQRAAEEFAKGEFDPDEGARKSVRKHRVDIPGIKISVQAGYRADWPSPVGFCNIGVKCQKFIVN